MAKRIVTRIGNVFCAEIEGKFKCFFQYIAKDMTQLNSSVIRVLEKSEYAVTANDLKNKSDIPILLFLACTGYQ